jgi:clan AA aspartic protease (TIGR02281 family)
MAPAASRALPLDSCGRTNKIKTSRWGRAIRYTQSFIDAAGRLAAMLLLLGAVTAGSAGITAAKDVRYPESGPVAFLLHLPDIWTAKVGKSGSMLVIGPDGSAAISLTLMQENEVTLAKTPDELANTLFFAAKAEPFNKHEKGVIGGVPADSYYSRLVRATNGPQSMKINMIKSLHGYVVLETILTAATIDSAQQAALAAALKGIRLIGAPSNPTPPKGPTNPSSTEVSSNPARTDGPPNPAHVEAPSNTTRIEIPLKSLGGTFVVPVFINGAITLNFVVDSGAADVAVPADVVGTLIRAGTIEKSDFTGKQTYVLADGSTAPTNTFVIRSLKVGDILIENVKGSVSPAAGSLLLGQSFLQRFKSWSMDNNKHVLVLEQ